VETQTYVPAQRSDHDRGGLGDCSGAPIALTITVYPLNISSVSYFNRIAVHAGRCEETNLGYEKVRCRSSGNRREMETQHVSVMDR